MNRTYDYNGHVVATSKATPTLRTVKKVFKVHAMDRDTNKYYTNGDFVVYLPRSYESVVAVRLISAEFPPLFSNQYVDPVSLAPVYPSGASRHSYASGPNVVATVFSNDTRVSANHFSFVIDIEDLNRTDECTLDANRSTYVDSAFAHIPADVRDITSTNQCILYNDKSGPDNVATFNPPLRKLDRMRIRTRLHDQQGNQGFIYWTYDGNTADGNLPSNRVDGVSNVDVDYSLMFEVEYLVNTFDDFSSFETRVAPSASTCRG